MNLALITRWSRMIKRSIPGVPFPCRAWDNWKFSKNLICDCECVCKVPYRNDDVWITLENGRRVVKR